MCTYITIDLPRVDSIVRQVIEHDINLDCVTVEAFINLRGLDEISNARKPVRVLRA